MTELLFLAVEEVIPPDHPVSILAIPLGLLFLGGSVFLLLWSNYGAKKGAAIYGVAFFGFGLLLGVFFWFGGPGIQPGLGINHLPGQSTDHYQERWYAFEAGSERAQFFDVVGQLGEFETVEGFLGVEDATEEELQADPAFSALSGSVGQAVDNMRSQFLPVDENNVAQIGVERRQAYEDDAADAQPAEAVGRAQPFFTARAVGDPIITEDPDTGVLVAAQQFQALATFTDDQRIPLEAVEVGEPVFWYAFFDPGQEWIPSALWTLIAFLGFALSLFWLDRLEFRDKKLQATEIEEPENLQVPIAQ